MSNWMSKGWGLSLMACLGGTLLVGCGDDSNDAIFFPPVAAPPTVTNFSLPNQFSPGETISVAQAVVAPAGISFGNDAFGLTYDPPVGQPITTVFFAEDLDCAPGATACDSIFFPVVPPDLPVNAEYLVTFFVRDQVGGSASLTRTVFVSGPIAQPF